MENYFDIVSYLNEGRIEEAGKKIIEIAKDVEDEDVRTVISEIEKEIMDSRHNSDMFISYSPYTDQITQATRAMQKCREERMKYLILHGLYLLTKGNRIILDMIKLTAQVKPRTYL
ncbi:hypothetical protein [Sulfuracidifex metallicus]|uniref:hypothetical protein n=1 Tax=Sulfuracidifex metallicus TaxID=47303 RepID=UPI002274BC8C|nr:hypothetical protein [Sulfuracidifex metallicus]MCY0849788.1 hypothetical protein [Sulfuracidifex metallicus]